MTLITSIILTSAGQYSAGNQSYPVEFEIETSAGQCRVNISVDRAPYGSDYLAVGGTRNYPSKIGGIIQMSLGIHHICTKVEEAEICDIDPTHKYCYPESAEMCTYIKVIDGEYTTSTYELSCIPSWQCRIPLDGYETDVNNCGEADRYNINCEPICVPNWQCEVDLDGKNTGYKIDINGCFESTYDDVMCPPGEEPPEEPNILFYVIVGGLGLIGLKLISKK